MRVALAIFLAGIFLASVLLEKAIQGVPTKELRRRARSLSDKKAAKLYKLAVFATAAELFLWAIGALSAAGLILLSAEVAWWLGLLTAVVIIWLVWASRPLVNTDGWLFKAASYLAPLYASAVSFLQPILSRFSKRRPSRSSPTALYEKEDLLEFLKAQGRKADNRVSERDLKIAAGALSFSDKTVGDVMTPRRKIKWVAASDPVGPMVMDELHKTGQTRFPVVKEVTKAANPEVIGSLYLKDLLNNLEVKGRIRDIMQPGAGYINESQSLIDALNGFLKTGKYLLVTVNNFEEVVGTITLEELLSQILGQPISDDFDRYDDIRAIASYSGGQTDGHQAEAEVE